MNVDADIARRMAAQHDGVRRTGPHWYRQYIGECPVCGRDASYRERVAGERPERPEDRYVWLGDTQTYDWCDV